MVGTFTPRGELPALAILALDELPQASVLVFDLDLRFVIARGGALPRYGYQEGALEGVLAGDVLPPDRWALYEGPYRAALDGKKTNLVVRSPDGALVYEVRISPITVDDQIVGGVSIAVDVTALVEAQERYQLLAENASDLVLLLTPDNRISWASPSATVLTKLSTHDLLGALALDWIHPDDRRLVADARAALLSDGQPREVVVRVGEAGSEYRWMAARATMVLDDAGSLTFYVVAMRDVDDEMQVRRRLLESEQLFRTATETAPIGMIITDVHGNIEFVNEAICHILQRGRSELLGRRTEDLVDPDQRERVQLLRAQTLAGGGPGPAELSLVRADGTPALVRRVGALIRGEAGSPDRVMVQIEDVTAERKAQEMLEFRAFHDELTGLRNRAWILDILASDLHSARRGTESVAVLFLDLDNFKVVNDSMGHAAGDEVLTVVGERIAGVMRSEDRVGRFGGDEFLVVLPEVTGPQQVDRVAARISAAIEQGIVVQGHRFVPTASLGIAVSQPGSTADGLLRDADAALFRAKSAGRSRWQFFDDAMHAQVVSRVTIEEELRRSLAAGEFVTHYQPIVSLADGSVRGHEALVRWNHPTRGLLPPDAFLAVAEETGLIVGIGCLVLEQVCSLIAAEPGLPGAVSVNVSSVEFSRSDWLRGFRGTIDRHSVDPARLVVEVTETAVLPQVDVTASDLEELRALGVGVQVDDFGTGYSSISLLRDLPVTGLKLDAGFVRDLGDGASPANALAAGVAGLAKGLGLMGIAEGIETESQARILRDLGWSFGQGYYYGRPGPRPMGVTGRQA